MKSCIRIPRLFLPRTGAEEWAAPPCDCSRQEWEALSNEREGLSALSCTLPDYMRGKEEAERFEKIRDNMYAVLENGDVGRIERGFLLVHRQTPRGIRRGLVAAVDLEEFSFEGEIRPSTEVFPVLTESRMRERERAILEFPHTVLCFKDRRDKLMRGLGEEDFEPLYEFALPGCVLSGYFIPDFEAGELARELYRYADPCFGVLDGNHTLAAAKMYWDKVKRGLSVLERRNNPARFALAEFVNLCDPAVQLADRETGAVVKKDDLLSLWKSCKRRPPKSFRLQEERYCLEGREISYD